MNKFVNRMNKSLKRPYTISEISTMKNLGNNTGSICAKKFP